MSGTLKERLLARGLALLADPRVARLATDPRVMRAVMQALQVPGRVQQFGTEQVAALAKRLNLASEEEVAQLRRTVRRLEEELHERAGTHERGAARPESD